MPNDFRCQGDIENKRGWNFFQSIQEWKYRHRFSVKFGTKSFRNDIWLAWNKGVGSAIFRSDWQSNRRRYSKFPPRIFFYKNCGKWFGFYKKPYLSTIKIRESVFSPGLQAFMRKPGFFWVFSFEKCATFGRFKKWPKPWMTPDPIVSYPVFSLWFVRLVELLNSMLRRFARFVQ